MSKRPPSNLPEVNDRCCLRGDTSKFGILARYNNKTQWAQVVWNSEQAGPRICHRYEPQRIDK